MKRTVIIIGGGVAGLAAAVRLAEADHRAILIESRKRLGGRAGSFSDPRTGRVLDNCQHVLLGCCTHLIDLYDRLGVLERIAWHRALYWTRGRGVVDTMRAGLLPAPLHLLPSLRRMRLFDSAEKRAIGRAMWRMIRLGENGRMRWREKTFAEFLDACRQPPSVVQAFWNTVIVGACNAGVWRVSAAPAMQVFQQGLLANRWSYTMGLATVPLVELYGPAQGIIEAAGGEVRLGTSARAIAYDGRRVTGVVTTAGVIEGAAVISAVPPDRLGKLVGAALRGADTRLQELEAIEMSPILGVHLHFDQSIMELPHLVLVERGIDWLFNKGIDTDGGQYVHAVKSAADEWMGLSEVEIVRRTVDDVHHVLPASRGLEPTAVRAVKEKRATFAPTPEVERHRPRASPGTIGLGGGGVENLFLAGDWCDTGWPATMEGAVRSGYAAAGAVAGVDLGIEEVPPAWLARQLGLG